MANDTKLMAVLRPFAKYAEALDACYPTRMGAEFHVAPRICTPSDTLTHYTITLGELREALKLLAYLEEGEQQLELHERTAFEGWARSQWTNHQSIPDNAWKGWLARAQQPQAVIMVNGAAYTPKQISNAIAMATSGGFRPQDLPSE